MNCANCGSVNAKENRYCKDCGSALTLADQAVLVPGEDDLFYCHKHRKETTRVRCGRCERPICTRCLVVGPAGVRCRDCARNKVPLRMRGLAHNMGRTASGVAPRQVWYIAIWVMLFTFVRNLFGGGGDA